MQQVFIRCVSTRDIFIGLGLLQKNLVRESSDWCVRTYRSVWAVATWHCKHIKSCDSTQSLSVCMNCGTEIKLKTRESQVLPFMFFFVSPYHHVIGEMWVVVQGTSIVQSLGIPLRRQRDFLFLITHGHIFTIYGYLSGAYVSFWNQIFLKKLVEEE